MVMTIPDGTPTLSELFQFIINVLLSWIIFIKTFWVYIVVIIIPIVVLVVVLDLLSIKFGHDPKEFEE
jgi:hypothetical protein